MDRLDRRIVEILEMFGQSPSLLQGARKHPGMGPRFSYVRLVAYLHPVAADPAADGIKECKSLLCRFLQAVELDCLDLDNDALCASEAFKLVVKAVEGA